MKPTDILTEEHRIIEQVLDCLERIIGRASSQGKLDKQSAEKAVSFFRNFADRCHHAKEEDHLFPAMEARGLSQAGGPTGVMREEHRQGRDHVRMMDESIEAASHGDPSALHQFIQHARAYTDLLRLHIEKEDHCLFPMANQSFTEDNQLAVLRTFEKVEAEEIGTGVHQSYLEIANELARRYGVPLAASAHGQHECHHGHP